MLADISSSGNKSRLLMSGHRSRKTTTSFKMRTFKTVAFNGDTCDDNVEKGIGRGRRVVMDKFGSELRFEPEPPRTEPEVQFRVLKNG